MPCEIREPHSSRVTAPSCPIQGATLYGVDFGSSGVVGEGTVRRGQQRKLNKRCHPSSLVGAIDASASVAVAQADLTFCYDNITTLCTSAGSLIPSSELGGISFAPGLYYAPAYLTLGGVLTFDAAGDMNSVFVISSSQYLAVDTGAMMVSRVLNGEN